MTMTVAAPCVARSLVSVRERRGYDIKRIRISIWGAFASAVLKKPETAAVCENVPSSAPSPGPVTRCDVRYTSVRPSTGTGNFHPPRPTVQRRRPPRRGRGSHDAMEGEARRVPSSPLSPSPLPRRSLTAAVEFKEREGRGRGRVVCSIGAVRERLPIRLRLPRFVLHSIRSVRRTLLAAARNRNRQSESERESPADERAQALCLGKSTQHASSK